MAVSGYLSTSTTSSMEPFKSCVGVAHQDKDKERIKFEALLTAQMKLGLELFDLGQERVKKSTQEKLNAAKKSLSDRSILAVSRINKRIVQENATQSLNILMQNWKVSLEASPKYFNEKIFVADEGSERQYIFTQDSCIQQLRCPRGIFRTG
ncbi:hypothetical protein EAF04_000440 [Stromatinia cepivora]|nr:hypothetical protein EAF04_000440 [Stromatinia cepivora]